MNDIIKQLSRELASDISKEVKLINKRLESGELSRSQIKGQLEAKRELNRQRIKTLGLYLIQGGKA